MGDRADFFALPCLGCRNAAEALLCLPKTYIDKTRAHERIHRAPAERAALFQGKLVRCRGLNADGQATRGLFARFARFAHSVELTVDFADASAMRVRLFGARIEELAALVDQTIVLQACARPLANGPTSLHGATLAAVTGCIEPQYVGVPGGISGQKIRCAVHAALGIEGSLDQAALLLQGNAPIESVLHEHGITARALLQDLHRPATLRAGDTALAIARACVVREIRSAAVASRVVAEPCPYDIDQHLIALVAAQKETLSQDQRRALNAIRLQVNDRRGARILLNGDVGTGKTLVFLLALAAIASTSGKRVAVVVPSDLVARQIHAQAQARFPQLQPCLVMAGSGDVPDDSLMLIGTQALFHRAEHLELEALVVDEQHKFSVAQRTVLARGHTHVIEASATPIPRSLALAIFDGWMQVRIVNCPVQKTIVSRIAMPESRRKVVALAHAHLQRGHKVVFLYPKVDGQGATVRAAGERLDKHFQGKVTVVHGQMGRDAKESALKAFASGERPIIAASTAVEVGVDVPDIGLMVVSGADRFAVAQLHQLRGRLARNGGKAHFVMMLDKKPSKLTELRLRAVCQHADGFSLAERDMELRGFGDVLGDLQSGQSSATFKLPRLQVADFTKPAGV